MFHGEFAAPLVHDAAPELKATKKRRRRFRLTTQKKRRPYRQPQGALYASKVLRTDREKQLYKLGTVACKLLQSLSSSETKYEHECPKKKGREYMQNLRNHVRNYGTYWWGGKVAEEEVEAWSVNALESLLWFACDVLGIRYARGDTWNSMQMIRVELGLGDAAF